MGDSNPIFTSGNAYLAVTNIAGTAGQQMQFQGVPLGTSDGTATGALGVKVVGAGSGGAINVSSTHQTVTPTAANMGASASVTIPAGSKGWTFTVLTGTGGVGGTTLLPAGFSDSDTNTLAASLTVTTASASSAYVRYNS